MPELSQHMLAVQLQLQELVKRYELLQRENLEYKKQIHLLKAKEETLEEDLNEANQQNLVLKAAAVALEPEDKKELEQRINAYLRNIEKCISILSH